MPVYEITGPDGKKYKVNAPKGANEQDAINHVQETYYSSAPVGKDRSKMSLGEKLLDSPIGGVLRGLRDIPDGGAQLLTRGLEAISPAGSGMEKFFKSERERVEAINNEAERDYQENFRQGGVDGLDTGRLIGNIAASLPLAAVTPMAATSAPMLARMAAGAGSGAAASALMPVDEQGQENFAENKLAQVGLGAAMGSLSPVIADSAGKFLSRFKGKPTAQQLEINLQGQLEKQGIDFSKLSDQTKASLLKDAQEALKAGGALNPEALARKADFEALGIKPTHGQLTRDPMQFAFEKNTRGIQGAGDSLSQRFNEQNAQLIEAINKSRSGAGMDRFSAGASVIDELQKSDAARKSVVDSLYQKARETAGINTPLNPSNFAQSLNNALDDAMVGDALPAGVRKAINQVATGDLPFTIQKAEQIRQAINGQMTNVPSRENFALGLVNKALQNEIDNVGSSLGDEAGNAFKMARAAASQRFGEIDASAPLKAAIEGVEPDKFIQKFVINGTAKDLMTIRANLNSNPGMWEEIRGQVIDHIKEKGLNGATDEFGNFSQSAYNKALKQIGDAKLKILFNPDEVTQLKRIGRVASSIQVQPAGSAVNNSGTSQAVANLMNRLSGVPYLKELAVNPIMNFRLQGQVNSALNPSLQLITKPAELDPALIRVLQAPLAASGYPAVKGLLE